MQAACDDNVPLAERADDRRRRDAVGHVQSRHAVRSLFGVQRNLLESKIGSYILELARSGLVRLESLFKRLSIACD